MTSPPASPGLTAWLKPGKSWEEGIAYPASLRLTSGMGLGLAVNLELKERGHVRVMSFEVLTACCMSKMQVMANKWSGQELFKDHSTCMACLMESHSLRARASLGGEDLLAVTKTLEENLASVATGMDSIMRTLTVQAFLDTFIGLMANPQWTWPREPAAIDLLIPEGVIHG